MGYTRLELKNDAKQALTGKWGISVGVTLIYTLIAAIASQVPIIGPIALFLCSPALAMGFTLFFLKISRKEDAGIETLFQWFPKLFKAFGLNFMIQLFVFLWSLLFIIPVLYVRLPTSGASTTAPGTSTATPASTTAGVTSGTATTPAATASSGSTAPVGRKHQDNKSKDSSS